MKQNMDLVGADDQLDCFWVSPLDAIHAAGYKPRQLRLAAELGLRVPRTLITNNPAEARAFYEQCRGDIIFKTIQGGFIPVDGDAYDTIYTSRVETRHPALFRRDRRVSPVTFGLRRGRTSPLSPPASAPPRRSASCRRSSRPGASTASSRAWSGRCRPASGPCTSP